MGKINSKLYVRHGDVFIFKIDKKISTNNFTKQKEVVLALGEVTGHSHKLKSMNSDILIGEMGESNSYIFELTNLGSLSHEEHDEIKLEPGQYISMIQVEYDPIEHTRKVID
jgi:hypothetical protein